MSFTLLQQYNTQDILQERSIIKDKGGSDMSNLTPRLPKQNIPAQAITMALNVYTHILIKGSLNLAYIQLMACLNLQLPRPGHTHHLHTHCPGYVLAHLGLSTSRQGHLTRHNEKQKQNTENTKERIQIVISFSYPGINLPKSTQFSNVNCKSLDYEI